MTQLLVYREQIQKFYQKYSFLLNPIFRFLAGYITFSSMNRMIGYHPQLNHLYVELLCGVLCILLPENVMLFFVIVFAIGHIYYVSMMLALVTGMIFGVLYFAYVKFVPEHAYLILAFPILFSMNLVYVLPILLGLIMSPLALLPIMCGTGVYYLLLTITSVIGTSSDTNANLYHVVIQQFFGNQEMYVLIFVFYGVMLVVCLIRNRAIHYMYEKAIITGGITNLVLLLTVNFLFALDMEVFSVFLGTFASVCIVLVIQFMRLMLTYTSVENLQFEDEEYVYYVRAVPKANVAAPRKRIKRFAVRRFTENGAASGKKKVSEKTGVSGASVKKE